MVQYSTCMNWLNVDEVGGISVRISTALSLRILELTRAQSIQSFPNQQGLPFYCFNYA